MKRSVLILCVFLVLAGCIGGGGEVVIGQDHDHADHSAHDHGEEDHEDHGGEEAWVCCKALTASCVACSERLTKQEWLDKTCGPGCTDAVYAGWDEETNMAKWDCVY